MKKYFVATTNEEPITFRVLRFKYHFLEKVCKFFSQAQNTLVKVVFQNVEKKANLLSYFTFTAFNLPNVKKYHFLLVSIAF